MRHCSAGKTNASRHACRWHNARCTPDGACGSVARRVQPQLESQQAGPIPPSRRQVLAQAPLLLCIGVLRPGGAHAFETTPQGYRRHSDRLDGYTFVYPDPWIPVTSSGNDVFYRNTRVPDENVFVDVSSPSSSNFASVEDLGPPAAASQRLRRQFANEFMSTRIGITREIEPVFAESRTGGDGQLYYDIGVRVKSYASRQQLAVTEEQRQGAIVQEFDRLLITTLGVANKRLYQFRLQTSFKRFQKTEDEYKTMVQSFRCKEVDV